MPDHTETTNMVRELLAACESQHDALDILFAMLVERDRTFFPSKSGKPWEAMVAGHAAITRAKSVIND